jgi:lysophospholipase L1-like esterase
MINRCFLRPLLLIFSLFCVAAATAQPFIDEIRAFKKQDSLTPPPPNGILFIGSSSFTNWKDVSSYFPGYPILNRGFGGSSLPDVIRYAKDIIFPYQPKQIVIYCGENDLADSDTVTGKMVYERFIQLFSIIRKQLPAVPLAFISLKPSPSRWQLNNKMIAANQLIKKYLRKKNKTVFIDVYHKMLNEEGLPMKDIFSEDSLHMNAKGYAIWQKLIAPCLVK